MRLHQRHFLGFTLLLGVILSIWFVSAILSHVVLPAYITNNESVEYIYNISVNNTYAPASGNITQVNITIPSNFTFIAGTNGTDVPLANATFTNSTTANNYTLSWTNSTTGYYVINGSDGTGEKKYFWFNATATPGTYNFTVTTVNASDSYTSNVTVKINDTTFPLVSYGLNTESNAANKSQNWIYVNVSVTEDFPQNISFIVWNSTATWNHTNYTMATQTSNTTINWTSLSDGHYSYNVTVTDSQGNENSTDNTRNITLDTTDPTATASCSPSTVSTGASFPCTCSGSDATSGVNTISTSSTSGSITSTSQTGTFTYSCSVTDYAGNSISSTVTYVVEQTPAGGGSSGATTPAWTTHSITESLFEQGYTKELGANNRIKVQIAAEDHFIGVVSVSATQATIEVSSDPVQVILAAGEDAKVDVDGDGFYDVYVLLNSITGSKADVTIQKIHDEVPEGGTGVETTGEQPSTEEGEGGGISWWIWVVIALVVIIIAASLIRKKG